MPQARCNAAHQEFAERPGCRQMADRLAEDGFAKAGYTVVGIDDCWLANERDAKGRLQAAVERFPGGMAHLADYVHGIGLQFGIYGKSSSVLLVAGGLASSPN